jgi:hypothetical protein
MGWGEAAHVHADLDDDQLGGGLADPTDLIQPVDRSGERGDLGLDLGLSLGDVGAGLLAALGTQFDLGVLQQLLHPLLRSGAHPTRSVR